MNVAAELALDLAFDTLTRLHDLGIITDADLADLAAHIREETKARVAVIKVANRLDTTGQQSDV